MGQPLPGAAAGFVGTTDHRRAAKPVTVGANGTGSSTPYTFTSTNQYQLTGSGTATNGQVTYIGTYGLTIIFAAGTSYSAGMQYTLTNGRS